MKEIFIIDGLRTPIGRMGKSLRDVSAVSLGAMLMKTLVEKNNINGSNIDEVIMGNVVSSGLGQNPARQSLIRAGLPVKIPAFTINKVCGSGLKSVILGVQAILSGDSDLILAGGMESVSQSPYIFPRSKKLEDFKTDDAIDSLINDGLWCKLNNTHMGIIAEYTTERFKISREEQDNYALESHQKASFAQEKGLFKKEIVPVEINGKDILDIDERLRKKVSIDTLASLPSAFKHNGTVTAGNSSAPADGAAILILSSEEGLKKLKQTPIARILGYATSAVEPELVFTAPAISIKKCLRAVSLKMSDIDIFEINEAFAVQALLTIKLTGLDIKRLNVFGGTLALGHPLGASGARGLVTLINILKTQKKKTGIVSICLGGGIALSLAICST